MEAIFPLSAMQQSLLFNTLAAPAADPGFLQLRCTLAGDLDPASYRRAWASVVERHPALRTSVHWQDVGKPLQVTLREVALPWTVHDFRDLAAAEQQERLGQFLGDDRERRLDLSRAPAMRLALFQLRDDEWELVWSCHHVLLDGWSGALVLGEVASIYEALRGGTVSALPAVPPYRDYVAWLQRQDSAAAADFWRRALSGMREPTPLPFDRAASAEAGPSPEYERASLELAAADTAALHALARTHRLTLNTVVQGAWAVLLGAHAGRPDVCFGATVSGRAAPVPGIEAMVGLFINVLPVRVSIAAELPLSTWLERLQQQQGALRGYEHIPAAQLQAWSEIPGSRRLFDSLLVFENFPTDSVGGTAERRLRLRDLRGGITTGYPLTLVVAPGERLALHLVYDRGRFGHDGVSLLLQEVRGLLQRMAARPTDRLAELLPSEREAAPAVAASAKAPTLPEPAPRAGRLPPRDSLELQLVQIWESVLGVHPIAVDDDFFALGGHSLTAAQLFDRVEHVLGKRLPLATLFQATTVESLANRLRDEGWRPPWSSLVPLQPQGSQSPLFCIHSYEGHVLFYRELARHLAPDRPVYGLQAVGLDGEQPPLDRVEAMATRYIQELRSVQPRGPYFLAAMCFGISVAFEMAQQLHAQGEEVAELIMLDSGFLSLRPIPAAELPRTRAGRVLRRLRVRAEALAALALRPLDYLRDNPRQRRERRAREAILKAWHRYRPRVYPGQVTLVRSTDYGAKQEWHVATWSNLAASGVRVLVVPGGHLSFLQEPYVGAVAAQLRTCLDAVVPKG